MIAAIAVCTTLLIRAEFQLRSGQIYILKPLATGLVMALACTAPDFAGQAAYRHWILLGLLCSLGGDIALMFQQHRKPFLVGLSLFLLAHLAYTIAFTLHAQLNHWTLGAALALLAVGLVFYRMIAAGLDGMRLPVILYFLVISIMVAQAASLAGEVSTDRQLALLALGGALLFYISDVILAANRFWRPWTYNRISLAFYYGGQTMIAASTHYLA